MTLGFYQHLLFKGTTELTLTEVPWNTPFTMRVEALDGQLMPLPWTVEQDGDHTKVAFPKMEAGHPVYRLLVFPQQPIVYGH